MHSIAQAAAGLGFRRELIPALQQGVPDMVQFFEIAPENWAGMGGRSGRALRAFTERFPFVCHGLSLSLGGPGPLDETLLRHTRDFMREHGMPLFTEHLSWCADDSHLYELLPIPLTEEAVRYTAERIARTQDILGMRIGGQRRIFVPPKFAYGKLGNYPDVPPGASVVMEVTLRQIYTRVVDNGE